MSIETTIHHLQSLLGQGKLSRREFFKKTAALGLTASLASMYAAKPVLAIVPKKGGIFRAGISGASNTDSLTS